MNRTESMTALPNPPVRPLLHRVALVALLWLGLSGADWRSWIVGGPVVLVSAWVSFRLVPSVSWRVSIYGGLGFVWYFLRQSLSGGWDVARRALGRVVQLNPGIVSYTPRLPVGAPRWFFCAVISLLPGTAVVGVSDAALRVHALDASEGVARELRELEIRVARVFGLDLTATKETQR